MLYCEYCGGELGEKALKCCHCGKEIIHRPSATDYRLCTECGEKNALDAVECTACGSRRTVVTPEVLRSGYEPVPNVVYCRDGKYRWARKVSMFKDFSMLTTAIKTYCGIAFAVSVMLGLLFVNLNGKTEGLNTAIAIAKYGIPSAFVLAIASYLLALFYYGGSYCVVYELDGDGIMCMRMKSYFGLKRAREYISYLSGLKRKPKSISKDDLYIADKMSEYIDFKSVVRVRYNKRASTVLLTRGMFTDKIYIYPQQFTFVFGYIKNSVKSKQEK